MFRLVRTADGSYTLYNEKWGDYYHSLDGAFSESQYVFIEQGFIKEHLQKATSLHIIEVGLGLGFNLLATLQCCEGWNGTLLYEAWEPEPVPSDWLKAVWEKSHFSHPVLNAIVEKVPLFTTPNITIRFHWKPWRQGSIDYKVDRIFYDLFAPRTCKSLWERPFLYACECLNPQGMLLTYSITGTLRRLLESHGFAFVTPKGFGKKRQMLRVYGKQP